MVLTAITVAMTLSFSTPSFRDTASCLLAIARTRKRGRNDPAALCGRWAIPESSRMNADDRLSLNPLGWVEGGDGIVEGSHLADVCP